MHEPEPGSGGLPAPPDPAPATRRAVPWRRGRGRGSAAPDGSVPWRSLPWRAISAAAALVLVLVVALLPSPYAIERPGPVYDTLGSSGTGSASAPLISIPDKTTYPTKGALDLLTVYVDGLPSGGPSWLELARAWLDPSQAVVPLEAIYPIGVTQQQNDQQSAAEMTGSQRSAVAAALSNLGYDVRGDVKVTTVRPGSAASAVLKVGDVIRTYGGTTVDDSCSLQDVVVDAGAKPTTVVLQRGGTERTVTVTPRRTDVGGGDVRPLLGVTTAATFDFPFTVRLRISDVGGPSAGMMFALGIIDKLTPGSLTGGRHVAGTGTICGDGSVGAIGGIVQKMAAARGAGATLFLAPAADCDEVVGHVPNGLDVVAVRTLSNSLAALKKVRETGSSAGLPRCTAQVGSPG